VILREEDVGGRERVTIVKFPSKNSHKQTQKWMTLKVQWCLSCPNVYLGKVFMKFQSVLFTRSCQQTKYRHVLGKTYPP